MVDRRSFSEPPVLRPSHPKHWPFLFLFCYGCVCCVGVRAGRGRRSTQAGRRWRTTSTNTPKTAVILTRVMKCSADTRAALQLASWVHPWSYFFFLCSPKFSQCPSSRSLLDHDTIISPTCTPPTRCSEYRRQPNWHGSPSPLLLAKPPPPPPRYLHPTRADHTRRAMATPPLLGFSFGCAASSAFCRRSSSSKTKASLKSISSGRTILVPYHHLYPK